MEESRTRTAASVLGAERDVCMYSRNVRRRRVAGRRAHPYQVILSSYVMLDPLGRTDKVVPQTMADKFIVIVAVCN